MDKHLPENSEFLQCYSNPYFPPEYFTNLHDHIKSFNAYNHLGARVKLPHSKINVSKFREYLPVDFDDIVVLQYLEFGFPLGLVEDFVLVPNLRNHSSSYEYFSFVDKFVMKELKSAGITGPFFSSPFQSTMISPMMTAPKKPASRRTVFDASFGDFSLNLNTPEKIYVGEEYLFMFPKLDDFSRLIVSLGKGCFLWKRDLSRFFLQLPLDPYDYDKVGFVWRGNLYHSTSFVWGCRHAGMSGQRVSNCVSEIHRSLGRRIHGQSFNILNYSDDYAGCQDSFELAMLSFTSLSSLLLELGLEESSDKAVSPSTTMLYLGVEYDTVKMEMRIGQEKCKELRLELKTWYRRTVATKQELQSILGKLMWVSRAVRHSRAFINRIIAEIKQLTAQKQKITLSSDIRKDLLWCLKFMDTFNGIELIIPDEISVNIAGDACPMGLGAWNLESQEYFSSMFPLHLQDPQIPIHVKEFICIIISVKVWGPKWEGKRVKIYCDNDAVVDVITYNKPKDVKMQSLLREFLYYVCAFNFSPVASKIGTKENLIADFLSRNFNPDDAMSFFKKQGLCILNLIPLHDSLFELKADW